MAIIRPFRGVRYDESKVGSLDGVVTPPYDVISPRDQDWYHERHPYNVVRLILPKGNGDTYQRSAATLSEWMEMGVLAVDSEPSIYVCAQEYDLGGERRRRMGFTCLLRLEDFTERKVLPHENILSQPLEDRINTIRATGANLDSVFGLYSDGQVDSLISPLTERPADASAVDKDGVKCSVWRVEEPYVIARIAEILDPESVLIADGHHRYTAALAYREEMRAHAGGVQPDAPYEFVMMTLVSLTDPGLVVLPTHRLVQGIDRFSRAAFIETARGLFDIQAVEADRLESAVKERAYEGHVYGIYTGQGGAYLARLKPDVSPEKAIRSQGSDALKRLDVSVLHSLLFEQVLGMIPQDIATQAKISYTRDVIGAMKSVDEGSSQMLVLMNPTKIAEVREVASAGERMPQKSTYFHPKLLTGMVMRLIS